MEAPETVLRGLVRVSEALRGFMGSQSSKFSHFCNPCGVICTFSRAQDGGQPRSSFVVCLSFSRPKGPLGGPKMVNMVQNGHMASPGSLGRVSGDPQRVHGVSWDGLESSCEGLWRS